MVSNAVRTLKTLDSVWENINIVGRINIHVGGPYGDFEGTAKRFCRTFLSLPEDLRRTITIENDDRPNGWSLRKLFDLIYLRVGIPIVLDLHHHRFCNNGESQEEAMAMAFSTWPPDDRVPKIHYSESRTLQNSGDLSKCPCAHSDYVDGPVPSVDASKFSRFEDYYVMLECKAKEKALLQLRNRTAVAKKENRMLESVTLHYMIR